MILNKLTRVSLSCSFISITNGLGKPFRATSFYAIKKYLAILFQTIHAPLSEREVVRSGVTMTSENHRQRKATHNVDNRNKFRILSYAFSRVVNLNPSDPRFL